MCVLHNVLFSVFVQIQYVNKIHVEVQARNSGFEKQEAEDQPAQTKWVQGQV